MRSSAYEKLAKHKHMRIENITIYFSAIQISLATLRLYTGAHLICKDILSNNYVVDDEIFLVGNLVPHENCIFI